MTKEELEKEAEEYAYEKWTDYPEKQEIAEQAYIASAEPREKRIEELEKENKVIYQRTTMLDETLENKNNKIAELEAQIEEMKSDVRANIKWADQNKNEQMYCKLNVMFNQWEIKEK